MPSKKQKEALQTPDPEPEEDLEDVYQGDSFAVADSMTQIIVKNIMQEIANIDADKKVLPFATKNVTINIEQFSKYLNLQQDSRVDDRYVKEPKEPLKYYDDELISKFTDALQKKVETYGSPRYGGSGHNRRLSNDQIQQFLLKKTTEERADFSMFVGKNRTQTMAPLADSNKIQPQLQQQPQPVQIPDSHWNSQKIKFRSPEVVAKIQADKLIKNISFATADKFKKRLFAEKIVIGNSTEEIKIRDQTPAFRHSESKIILAQKQKSELSATPTIRKSSRKMKSSQRDSQTSFNQELNPLKIGSSTSIPQQIQNPEQPLAEYRFGYDETEEQNLGRKELQKRIMQRELEEETIKRLVDQEPDQPGSFDINKPIKKSSITTDFFGKPLIVKNKVEINPPKTLSEMTFEVSDEKEVEKWWQPKIVTRNRGSNLDLNNDRYARRSSDPEGEEIRNLYKNGKFDKPKDKEKAEKIPGVKPYVQGIRLADQPEGVELIDQYGNKKKKKKDSKKGLNKDASALTEKISLDQLAMSELPLRHYSNTPLAMSALKLGGGSSKQSTGNNSPKFGSKLNSQALSIELLKTARKKNLSMQKGKIIRNEHYEKSRGYNALNSRAGCKSVMDDLRLQSNDLVLENIRNHRKKHSNFFDELSASASAAPKSTKNKNSVIYQSASDYTKFLLEGDTSRQDFTNPQTTSRTLNNSQIQSGHKRHKTQLDGSVQTLQKGRSTLLPIIETAGVMQTQISQMRLQVYNHFPTSTPKVSELNLITSGHIDLPLVETPSEQGFQKQMTERFNAQDRIFSNATTPSRKSFQQSDKQRIRHVNF